MKIPFLEIIEATTSDPNLLMWQYEDDDKEIKNGAKLTVYESQHVLFMNEGEVADVFGPGTYTLETKNIPILTSLKSWKYGFDSPFKATIYFFNTHQFINNKWGTPAPILMRDPEFGQVRVRAFGSFDLRISDPKVFFQQYAGTYEQLTIFELQQQLRDFIVPKFGEVLATEQLSVMDVAGNISEVSKKIEPLLKPYFLQLGVELTHFIITSVTLPDEVSAHYDKITNMNMVSDMDKFTKFNTATAIGQEGTAANDGTQNAIMAGLMMKQMQQLDSQNQVSTPTEDITSKLKQLKQLFENELIDEQEYKDKKADLINKM
ncbi:SPFH domain-containing protein [Flavobacterium ardleyense]|uniref:SPFH domain-containing protein n=1 Tax=Flavobacterium ardleyense TaxID=2038737 RepID=A0ABW5ZBJ7_9FLAO